MSPTSLPYYLRSLATLLRGVANWPLLPLLPFTSRPQTIRLRSGLQFRVRSLMDAWIVKETCLDRDYERHGAPLQDGWTIVDVGAGIGEFALLAAIEQPGATVYAFEPFPPSYDLLLENCRLNGAENVVPQPLAVASRSGTLTLAAVGAAVQHTTTPKAGETAAPTVEVPAITLGELFNSHEIERCDFLKMDCEGAEFDILLNSPPAVLQRIARLALEYHDSLTPHNHRELAAHLTALGFKVRTAPNPVHADLGFLYAARPRPLT